MIFDRFEKRPGPSESLGVFIPRELSRKLNAFVYGLKLRGRKVTKQQVVTLALEESLERWTGVDLSIEDGSN